MPGPENTGIITAPGMMGWKFLVILLLVYVNLSSCTQRMRGASVSAWHNGCPLQQLTHDCRVVHPSTCTTIGLLVSPTSLTSPSKALACHVPCNAGILSFWKIWVANSAMSCCCDGRLQSVSREVHSICAINLVGRLRYTSLLQNATILPRRAPEQHASREASAPCARSVDQSIPIVF